MGREGFWRLLNIDFYAPKQVVLEFLKEDGCFCHPENEGFKLIELTCDRLGLLLGYHIIDIEVKCTIMYM